MLEQKSSGSEVISRRQFLQSSAGCIAASSLLAPTLGGATARGRLTPQSDPLYFGAGTPDYPIVDTKYGKVRGITISGVSIFKGLHYGASTGGDNRFLPPKPPMNWDGVQDAFCVGSPCPQIIQEFPFYVDPSRPSEDCLVLNIWSPKPQNGSGALPVMLWIHGGGFANGSGGLSAYDGFNLAKSGNVLVVTVNHRLNIFGYTYLGSQDERFVSSGNCGQLDLVAALQWVQLNIEFFGGDPENVTIFGQSGGGAKVSTLIAMPSAKGLFKKAIVQSGSFLHAADAAHARDVTDRIFAYFKLKPTEIAALQRVSQRDLLSVYQELTKDGFSSLMKFAPVVDGHSLTQQPWTPAAPDMARSISMLVGTTEEEAAAFLGERLRQPIASDAELLTLLQQYKVLSDLPVDRYPRLLEQYRKELPSASRTELLVRISSDTGMWRNALIQAERKLSVGGPPLYMYNTTWKSPLWGGRWASHGVDLGFVFGIPDAPGWLSADDSAQVRAEDDPHNDRYRVTAAMVASWAAFAHSGDPSTATLRWPAYDREHRATMVFDHQIRIVNDPSAALRKLVV